MFSCIFSFTFVLLVYQAAGEDDTAHLPGHMQPLGSHRPMEGDIERLDRIPDPVTFYEEYVEKKRPFVLEGAVKDTVPVKMWTDEYLKSHFGNITVSVELRKKEDRHGPGGKMTLQEFIGRYNEESVYVVDDVPQVMRSVVSMPGCLCCGGFLQNTHMALMWFSSGGTKSVLHTDTAHNMHCLVAGEKRFVMIPPEFAKTIGPEWERQGYYNLDVEAVNMTAYPNMVDVPWYRAVLQPGDCMFLPFNWIHQVHSLGRNFGINLWWVPFSLSYQDCQENRDRPSLVSLKDLPLNLHVGMKVPFLMCAKDDGKVYAEDFHELFTRQAGSGILSVEEVHQIFDMIQPGVNGVLDLEVVKAMTDQDLNKLYHLISITFGVNLDMGQLQPNEEYPDDQQQAWSDENHLHGGEL